MQKTNKLKLGLAALILCTAGAANAQQATAEQQDAVRKSCRSDYIANCSSVPTGGAESLQCLQKNLAKLSPACKTAVSAMPKVADKK